MIEDSDSKQNRGEWLFTAVLVLVALGLLGFGGHQVKEGYERSETDIARVGLQSENIEGGTECRYSFELDGETREGWGRCDDEHTIGTLLEVYYDPDDPDNHAIGHSWLSGWVWGLPLGGVASFVLYIAWVSRPGRRGRTRPASRPRTTSRLPDLSTWVIGAVFVVVIGGSIVAYNVGPVEIEAEAAPPNADTPAAQEREREANDLLGQLTPPAEWRLEGPEPERTQLRDQDGTSSSAITVTYEGRADLTDDALRDWLASFPELIPADEIECDDDPPGCTYQGTKPGDADLELLVRVVYLADSELQVTAGTRTATG